MYFYKARKQRGKSATSSALHSERLRWRVLLARVTEGIELRLIEKAAEVLARAAAEAVAAAHCMQADPVHLVGKEVERLLAGTRTESH